MAIANTRIMAGKGYAPPASHLRYNVWKMRGVQRGMGTNKLDWIGDKEKFALIGLSVHLNVGISRLDFPGGLVALPDAAFQLPDHWREWLGSARIENVQHCNLFLLAKMPSEVPVMLNAESQFLETRVGHWFMGLTLASKFTAFDEPFLVSGGWTSGEIDVRTFNALDLPLGAIVADQEGIGANHLNEAARIGKSLEAFNQESWQEDSWRLLRCLAIYQDARREPDMAERIHQFTRCIEGLIVPEQGRMRRQFVSRTELFVGPQHHDLMGELYRARSNFEHLHEHQYLAQFDRETRIRLAELEAVSEWIARSCLTRILLDPALTARFRNVDALNKFWAKPQDERRAIWGATVDPRAMLADFNFQHVTNERLGARR